MSRRSQYKAKPTKKTTGYRKARGSKSTASRLNSARGYLREEGLYGRFTGPRAELKFFDVVKSYTALLAGATDNVGILTIPQNTTASGRIGRNITVKKINILGRLISGPGTHSCTGVRFGIYIDKQTNGALAGYGDLFKIVDATQPNRLFTFKNIANSKRFITLKEWRVAFNTGAVVYDRDVASGAAENVVYATVEKHFKWNKSCSMDIEYSGPDGSVDELKSNSIVLAYATSVVNSAPTIELQIRFRYSDS